MSRPTYSGQELIKFLEDHGYQSVRQRGSHRILIYEHPETGETRRVTVPLHDEIMTGTLQSIAEQCGADDFQRFLDWLEGDV